MQSALISHSSSLSLLIVLLMGLPATAQLKINEDGHVGLLTDPWSSRVLRINCDGCHSSATYGAHIATRNVSTAYGVYALAQSNQYSGYGIMSFANSGTASNNYGIYAGASSASGNNWAGYFWGNVFVSGSVTEGSDERFKKDIRLLNSTEMLDRILQIQPRSYQYLNEGELRQSGMPVFGTKEGEHLGLVAQELEVIFPELVIEAVSSLHAHDPEMLEEYGEEETVSTKGINYNGLISALIAGMQEQQAQIEALEARIEALENMMLE